MSSKAVQEAIELLREEACIDGWSLQPDGEAVVKLDNECWMLFQQPNDDGDLKFSLWFRCTLGGQVYSIMSDGLELEELVDVFKGTASAIYCLGYSRQ